LGVCTASLFFFNQTEIRQQQNAPAASTHPPTTHPTPPTPYAPKLHAQLEQRLRQLPLHLQPDLPVLRAPPRGPQVSDVAVQPLEGDLDLTGERIDVAGGPRWAVVEADQQRLAMVAGGWGGGVGVGVRALAAD